LSTAANDEELRELELLRARVQALEAELIGVQDWANRAVGKAQEQTYWLDRWQLDLNALMRRPGLIRAQQSFRAARSVYRRGVRLKRRYLG